MKRKALTFRMAVICLLLAGCGSAGKITHPYVQEYVPGQGNIKGNVSTEDFMERDARFEIGADKDGYAVFKNPDEAYNALLENYADGLSLIQKERKLGAISKKNYADYQIYGFQVTTGSEDSQQQAHFISRFFDIYENSFE